MKLRSDHVKKSEKQKKKLSSKEETDMLVAGYNSKFPFVRKMHKTYTMQELCTPWSLY